MVLDSAPDLEVVAADINPRVVTHLRDAAAHPPALHLLTSLHEGPALTPALRPLPATY